MLALQAFVLLVWAFIGLSLAMFSPSRRFYMRAVGLSDDEATELLGQKDEAGLSWGCRLFPGLILEIVQLVLVEPGYTLWAIFAHMQPTWLAYGVLSLVVLHGIDELVLFAIRKRGAGVYPPLSWFSWTKEAVFSLPSLYLWFLLFAMIGLIR